MSAESTGRAARPIIGTVRRALATLAVALAAVFVLSATSRPATGTHCCYVMQVSAHGEYKVDYGKDLSQQKTGTYYAAWSWDTATIAAYGPDGLTLRGPGLLFAHFSETDDVKDVLSKETAPYEPYEVRETCEPFKKSTSSDFTTYTKVSPVARAKFAQLDTGFKVSPGSGVSSWGPHCAQVDGADSHGLEAYLPQSMPVSVRSLKAHLAAEHDFSIGCWQAASVDHSSPTQHHFTGQVRIRVVFEFFPFGQLEEAETALENLAGAKNKVAILNLGNMVDDVQRAQKKGGSDHDCGT